MSMHLSGSAAWIVLVVVLWIGYRLVSKWMDHWYGPVADERPVYPEDADDV